MKNAKKWTGVILAASMIASLMAGCGNADSSTESTGETSAAETTAAETGSSESSSAAESTAASEETTAAFQYSEGLADNGFFDNLKALDYVTLPTYQGIEIPADVHTITDEKLQETLDSVLGNFAETSQITDREVADGDSVNIDYVGSVDGVEFEGGTTNGAGTTVIIGTTKYIDDFLEQLIGHKPGETVQVEVTFPEDYGKEELNGKDAVFVTKINYIEGEDVLPEFNDAFVVENFQTDYGWNNAEEMKEGIRSDLQESAETEFLWDYMTKNAKISELPETVLDYEKKVMVQQYTSSAANYGLDLATFINMQYGVSTVEELYEKLADELKAAAEKRLIIQALAEDASLSVEAEDLTKYFSENMGSEDYSLYEEYYGVGYLKMVVLYDQATSYLRENAARL